jgi:hypothetical protein
MKARKSKGAHGLRVDLMNVEWHLGAVMDSLESAKRRAREAGATDQLAVAVKALRAIASTKSTDNRSRGIAEAALQKMEVGT